MLTTIYTKSFSLFTIEPWIRSNLCFRYCTTSTLNISSVWRQVHAARKHWEPGSLTRRECHGSVYLHRKTTSFHCSFHWHHQRRCIRFWDSAADTRVYNPDSTQKHRETSFLTRRVCHGSVRHRRSTTSFYCFSCWYHQRCCIRLWNSAADTRVHQSPIHTPITLACLLPSFLDDGN